MKAANSILRKQSGIALLTTLLLLMLLSGMLVGFMLLVTSGQRMSGMDSDYNRAFYGGEAGMEKITADLATLFGSNYAPTGKQVDNIATKTPVIPGIQYFDQSNKSTYLIGYPKDGNGNPVASYNPITSGSSPYQGMSALETPYTLMVTSRTPQGSEVKLTRTTQTVGIPLFQFGMFSQTDLSFFPGPNFDFGGRVHSNGNLFLASGAMPLARYLAAGIRVGLGSDVAAGPDAPLFSVMRAGAYTQNALRAAGLTDAPSLAPADWLRLGTLSGAEALGLGDRIGSVEVGKEADLIAVDPSLTLPLEGVGARDDGHIDEMLSRLIFRAHPAMVRGAWVRGRLLPA